MLQVYLFPATSSTCSSVASASSEGSLPSVLSLRERTLRLVQPPSSLGTPPKRLRSTFRLVSFFSLPSERGSDFEGVRQESLIFCEHYDGASQLLLDSKVVKRACINPNWVRGRVFLSGSLLPTCKRFSVKMSSVRFSHSPIESVRWVSLFWSTFKMDSCFRQPGRQTKNS